MADNSKVDDPAQVTDEAILQYERKLKEELTGDQPLVSDRIDLASLEAEYEGGAEVFKSKIQQLKQTCNGNGMMRRIKKDGNCFYRAVSFSFCENIWKLQGSEWAKYAIEKLQGTKAILKSAGYDEIITEDFYEPFEAAAIKKDGEFEEKLLEQFCTDYVSDTIVCYLRLVTAAVLKNNADLFEAFILDSYPTLEAFISSQVEPMNIEADHVQIVAIANALGLKIKVANLDLSGSTLNYHEFEPMEPCPISDQPTIQLLFRPGHYDLIYM
ncbi:OTU domain, ubiquitin aldehyde binding [Chytridiales sp. JEL 0842]|nr:OTU domain, ubiquitin aldehyde binding [Chytridiales sp. JEL 0842]